VEICWLSGIKGSSKVNPVELYNARCEPRRRLGEGEAPSEPVFALYTQTQILGPDDDVSLILDGREVARFAAREILP
jgi:hypothetical protein